MRIRFALPLLGAAASVMLVGLGLAHAQEDEEEQPRVQVRPGTSPATRRLRPPGASDDSDRPQTPGQPGTPAAFEAGIEYEPVPPRERVTFNLEEADLPDLVRLISNITGKRFILPGKVRSIKATVYAPTKVTAAEAYNAFLSILEVNGLTVVPAGRYLKIVETGGIETEPITTYTQASPTPSNDRFITRLHEVQNVSAEDVANLLSRFKSQEGNITAYAPTNTVIITDTGSQIRRMLSLLEAIDIPRTGEQVWIEPVHYANAAELAEKLQEIFPTSSGGGSAGASEPASRPQARARRRRPTKASEASSGPSTVGSRAGSSRISSIIPDERTNSLIILATEPGYLRLLEMIRQLDVPLEGEGRIHVHYIQNGNAEDIANTLSSLIGGGGGSSGGNAQRGGQRGGQAGNAAAAAVGNLFEGEIRVTAHEPTNALVITSSLHDYVALRRVIERLDAARRQIFIEAVIMELEIQRSNQLGFSFHGGVPDFPTDGSISVFGSDAQGSLNPINPETLTGLALGVRGPNIENSNELVGFSIPGFGVVLNAIASSSDVNILSTPHLIAMDNVQAEINIGQNVPLQTSGIPPGALGGLGGLAGLAGQQGQGAGIAGLAGLAGGSFGGVQRQDVGTIIRITPHINERNEVRLELEEEISNAGPAQGNLGVVPINRRTAKTELMVRDQQTVVIGGLMSERISNSETKVPILGDIPLIGALFRDTTRERQKSNLLLFLTPYIIRDPSDLRTIFERKMAERQEFIDRYFVFGDHEYEPPIDFNRTRGLVAEIINELRALDEEAALAEALRSEPPPEHVPRAPVGAVDRSLGEDDVIISPDGMEDVPIEDGEVPEPNSAPVIQEQSGEDGVMDEVEE